MIPQNKQEAVKRALLTAFGVTEFDSAHHITTGLSSALIIRIDVKGQSYLLRIITRTDEMANPAHYFHSMQVGAEAGLAPAIRYLSVEDRISITDYISAKPFPVPLARPLLAQSIRQLHSLPKFPRRINYFDAMEQFMVKLKDSALVPESVMTELFASYEKLAQAYPRHRETDWVSSHNDLKPENFLFDGERCWLVDWEGAFLNDRYLDLAVLANFVTATIEEEKEFLQHYLGTPPGDYPLARLYLMQQLLHVYYFTLFMFTGSGGKSIAIEELERPGLQEVQQRIWKGEHDLADNRARQVYAWAHFAELQKNRHTDRYRESLKLVSGEGNG